jgi:hypothetical protein
MIYLDDLKVYGVNTLCMLILKIQNVNANLQAILLMMTIMYTVARTVTEIQKYNNNKKDKNNKLNDEG